MNARGFSSRFWVVGLALVLGAVACSGAGAEAGPASETPVSGLAAPQITPTLAVTPTTQAEVTATQATAATAAASAVSGSTPVVLLTSAGKGVQGDLQKWDGQALTSLTNWKYNNMPVVSPDGQWVAYLSTAEAVVNAGAAGASSGFPPANIWILNLSTGEGIRIASQPDGVTYPSDKLISRNQPPSWSPDSSALAWVEVDSSGERLEIYNVAAKTAQAFPLNLPAQCCEGAFRVTFWGTGAGSLAIDSFNGTSPDTTEQVIYPVTQAGSIGSPVKVALRTQIYGWVVNAGKPYLSGLGDNGSELIDPATGESAQAAGRLALGSGSGGLSVVSSSDGLKWTLRDGGKDVATIPFSPFQGGAALSPDGQQAVFLQGADLTNPSATIYANGKMTTIPLDPSQRVLGVTWGPLVWSLQK